MENNTGKAGEIISTEVAQAFIKTITPEQVLRAYSGKPGCMCGCLGKYSNNPAYKAQLDAERGYEQPATNRHMVQIKKVLKLLQGHPEAMLQDGNIIYLPRGAIENKNYVIYLIDSAAI